MHQRPVVRAGGLGQLVEGLVPHALAPAEARRLVLLHRALHDRGDDRVEVPLGDLGEPVLGEDDLALLGDADAPVEAPGRAAHDGRVGGAAAPARRPPAPVEEGQRDVVQAAHVHQALLGEQQLPVGGQVAAVLVGVGVAHHHHLAVSARLQVAHVRRQAQQAPKRPRRAAEVVDGLEQGHQVDVRVEGAVLLPAQPGGRGQDLRGQDVGGALGEAHDHGPGGLGPVLQHRPAQLGEGARGLSGAALQRAGRGEGRGMLQQLLEHPRPLGLGQVAAPAVECGEVLGGLPQQARVLAHVEARDVEAEGLRLARQPRQAAVRQPPAAVRLQRAPHHLQVLHQLGGARVGALAPGIQALPDERQLPPVRLAGVARADLRGGLGHRPLVGGDRRVELLADLRHPGRDADAGGQRPHPLAQHPVGQVGVQVERLPHQLRRAVGVAVLVAARPRAVAQEAHRRPQARVVAIQQPLELLVHGAGGVEEHLLEEEERPAHLVDHPRAGRPHLVALPEDRDLLEQPLLGLAALARRQARVVEGVEALGHEHVLGQDGAARDLGGMRRHHQLDREPVQHRGDPLRWHRAFGEGREGRREALGLGAVGLLALGVAPAPAAHPMVLVGGVDELEEHREGADHAHQLAPVEVLGALPQLGLGPRRLVGVHPLGAHLLGQGAQPLLRREQALAALLHQHLAEQPPQVGDVRAERGVAVRWDLGRLAQAPARRGRMGASRLTRPQCQIPRQLMGPRRWRWPRRSGRRLWCCRR